MCHDAPRYQMNIVRMEGCSIFIPIAKVIAVRPEPGGLCQVCLAIRSRDAANPGPKRVVTT